MGLAAWVLGGIAGWTAIGLAGTGLAVATGDRRRAWRGLGWILAVWVVYLGVVVSVGQMQGRRVVARGQEECFGNVCYAVDGVASVGEFKGAGGGRLVQVSVRMQNRGDAPERADGLRAYLMDETGRRWGETIGLGGVPLTAMLPAGRTAEGTPVFRVEGPPRGLGLVLTRGRAGWGWLKIGDTDSLGHERTLLRLE